MTSGTEGRLAGKVAIITGAARGQGAREARLFVEHGARVVITDVLEDQLRALADELGDVARAERQDVVDEAGWQAVVAAATEAFGRLDVLVNNAAIYHFASIVDESVKDFEQTLAVNLVGPFLGMKHAAPAIAASGGGSIVNISSQAGMAGTYGLSAYGAAKWGVRGLTKIAAIELGPLGVRVNSIHPGPIDTDMLPPARAGDADRFGGLPLARVGSVDEVAALVLYLASDDASFITGAEISIDGGMSAGLVPRHARNR